MSASLLLAPGVRHSPKWFLGMVWDLWHSRDNSEQTVGD